MARNDKYSYNKITDIEQDWGRDPSNGKKYAGEVVQEFIKEQLIKANTFATVEECENIINELT